MRILLAAALSLVPATLAPVSNVAHADAAEAPEVTHDEFKKLVESKKGVIIDANGLDMYNSGHVPGAVSFAKNENSFASVLPKDKATPIVAYCGGPMCTAWKEAAKAAEKLGYTNIKHYKGGIKGWTKAGEKVEKS